MKISKVIYYTGVSIGFICMMKDHVLMGVGIMFFGLMINILIDSELSNYSSTSDTEKEPYYKNEFEEYQHFKTINKGIYREQAKGILDGRESASSPEKDCGLFTHEKANIWKQELKKRY